MFNWLDWDVISAAAGKIPFFILAQDSGQLSVKLSVQRLMEAVLIGLALAFVGYLTILPRLSVRMDAIQSSVTRIEQKQDEDVKELRRLLSSHMDGHPSSVKEQFNLRFSTLEKRLDRLEEDHE